jgi:(E)-4-hydroxy-3-methylbut-2-enyl-diphosphate synthase
MSSPGFELPYCESRFTAVRRRSRPIMIGAVGVGGDHPLVVQSMTTTPTQDVAATVAQAIAMAEVGCQIVRVTAQNIKAAQALGPIRAAFSAAGFAHVPLVADIHFLPQAAMEAALHVEKVRINPGNYADDKKFKVREYSDNEYAAEIERLHNAFSPIVLRCRELGRAMRIGTNHGSLSDRILNRYGDTPLGMCESVLEFLRIARSHNYHDIVISMKASNPKVMIEAYRLIAARMAAEDMHYPLHLGVTEAGDGDDARIKSAVGIGTLLADGLGDTIRVSLTEDPVAEIPVAQALAAKAHKLWQATAKSSAPDPIDPYRFTRRASATLTLGRRCKTGPLEPPRVIQAINWPSTAIPTVNGADTGDDSQAQHTLTALASSVSQLQAQLKDTPIEALLLRWPPPAGISISATHAALNPAVDAVVWDASQVSGPARQQAIAAAATDLPAGSGLLLVCEADDGPLLRHALDAIAPAGRFVAVATTAAALTQLSTVLTAADAAHCIVAPLSDPQLPAVHPIGHARQLASVLIHLALPVPLWIRNTPASAINGHSWFGDQLLEASIYSGALLCDGLGDLISIETVADPRRATILAYDVLQGARTRSSKTEFVACPSCGRTLFDLQTTTQRIRAATGHLKGVTIAVMGCIVNGPGEMADADFGYVGGAPGKINLYVGKQCVRYHIPASDAVEALIQLIRDHGKWVDPSAS